MVDLAGTVGVVAGSTSAAGEEGRRIAWAGLDCIGVGVGRSWEILLVGAGGNKE